MTPVAGSYGERVKDYLDVAVSTRASALALSIHDSDIKSRLDHATYGLSALNADLDTLLARITNATVPLNDARVGNLDNLDVAVSTRARQSDILSDATPFAGADIGKIRAGTIKGLGSELPVNKSLYDILWLDRYADESDSFLWNTSAYGTSEIDISALFTTPLTGTTRREYAVYLDFTGPAGDTAAWKTCTIKVKVKIDGTNYRTIDKYILSKSELAAAEMPGVAINVPMVAQDVQITMRFDVALGANQTIYYHLVRENKE